MPKAIVMMVKRCEMCWFNKLVTAPVHLGDGIPMVHVCTLAERAVSGSELNGIPQFCPLPDIEAAVFAKLKKDGKYDDHRNCLQ